MIGGVVVFDLEIVCGVLDVGFSRFGWSDMFFYGVEGMCLC